MGPSRGGGGSMEKLQLDLDGPDPRRGLSAMARQLIGSEILKIAAEIRAAVTSGHQIANFTVGDFSSKEFPIPDRLRDGTLKALAAGETNYPPADGVLRLREAVREFWRDRFQMEVPLESIVVAGGSRPVIYAAYRALIEPGDVVVYPVPSWNNNHYCHLVGARGVALETDPEHGFLPTAASLEPHLKTARLIALNTPLNPAGTVLAPEEVKRISEAVAAPVLRHHRFRDALHFLGSGGGGEPAPRPGRGEAALSLVRPGLLDADLRRRAPRDAGARGPGDGPVHDLRRRHLQVLRRDRRPRRLVRG